MDMDRIRQIIDWFAESGLQSFELAEGNDRIRLERGADGCPTPQVSAAVPVAASTDIPATSDDTAVRIEAPVYGICYFSPSPGEPPFVQPGQTVKMGDTLCLVEAMKVLNTVTAPRNGVVAKIAAPDGAEVEQGQLLVVLT